MTFIQAAAIALVPSVVWGWLFVSRNPESRQLVIVTFLLGTLAVAPLLLFMAGLGAQLHAHDVAMPQGGGPSMRQALSLLAFLAGIAVVLVGIIKLFELISRRVVRHSWRLGALLLAALLLLAATLSVDQLRENLGALGTPLAHLFHLVVIFSLFMVLLERFSARTVANAAVAGLASVLVVVVLNAGDARAGGDGTELSSISTIFRLPFLLGLSDQDALTLRVLNFMQVYLTFAVMAISTLLVVACVHVIYLLHENRWIKVLHSASLAFFALPFLAWAVAAVTPEFPLAREILAAVPAFKFAWFANIALLFALSAWSVHVFVGQSGEAAFGLFSGLYEEPLNFLGVGLFLTLFIAVFHAFGLSVAAFSLIFLAFAEEYSKHLIVRFTDDDSIRSIDDAIEFSIIVGLAFAFAENVLLYFPRLLAEGNVATLILRSVMTVLMHAVASGILGYFYGLAHFSAERVRSGHGARGRLYRLLHRTFLFRRERLYHEVKMFEGLILAGAYHAAYNLSASQGRTEIMLMLVGGGCAFLYYLLGLKSNRQKLGEISPKRHHDTFVRRLRRRSS
ncbi:MAG TPA: PrsW family glutamic-type intramembrane protease [Steroidobacteraceae bacterium]|nr:PrsW family glutamic-type intramembrane protease [Steroidobacteraceae bacterium]